MIDGKVNGILTHCSNQRCNLCGATPKFMNDIDECLQRPLNQAAYANGFSILHGWIRAFELFLNVLKRNVKGVQQSYETYTAEQKQLMSDQEEKIVTALREGLGILVNKPKQWGSVSTNDGNTARRFFQDPQKTAALTGKYGGRS